MKVYTVWITCLLESYQDTIIASLVKKGYTVGLASNGKVVVNHENQVSALLSYTLYNVNEEELTLSKLYEDLSVILTEMKGYFYSIVISESPNAAWAGSNIFLQPRKNIPQLPPNQDNKKSKLN